MKLQFAAMAMLISCLAPAQTKSNVSLLTRPVIIYTEPADRKFNANASLYISAERQVTKRPNRSSINVGLYAGALLGPEARGHTGSQLFYENRETERFTIGLTARYRFYASKNDKLNTFFGVAGELNFSRSDYTRQNLTSDTLPSINGEIEIFPALLPYQTVNYPKSSHYYNFFFELGCNYFFTGHWGLTATALWSMYDFSIRLSTGLNFKF